MSAVELFVHSLFPLCDKTHCKQSERWISIDIAIISSLWICLATIIVEWKSDFLTALIQYQVVLTHTHQPPEYVWFFSLYPYIMDLKRAYTKKAFNVERITGPAPLTGSAPEVDRVYPVPRPELRPSFVEIHSVISVQFCWQTNQTTKRSWKTDPISAAFTKLPRAFTQSWQRHINQEHTGRPAAASAQQKKKRPQQLIFIVM